MNTAIILQILAGLAGLMVRWWEEYHSPAETAKRDKEQRDASILQGRADLMSGNADAVTARIDRVLRMEDERPRNAGSTSNGTETRTTSTTQRLASFGIRVG